MLINPLNESALTYWSNTKYSEEACLNFCREYDDKYLFAKVDYLATGQVGVTISKAVERRREGHFPTYLAFFKVLQVYKPEKPLCGSIIVLFEDGLWQWMTHNARIVPIFHVGQYIYDCYSFVFPDASFLESSGQEEDKIAIDNFEKKIQWHEKYNKLIWRGAGSGLGINGPAWMEAPRIKICMKAKEFRDKSLIDVGISKILDVGYKEYADGIVQLGLQGNEIPFMDFLYYKYQIDLDGMCCAWLSYFRKLYSNCVTFKVESEYQQWYYHGLKPWKHYIPVTKNMDDLEEVIKWAINHDAFCKNIARESTEYMKTITVNSAMEETYNTLAILFERQQQLSK